MKPTTPVESAAILNQQLKIQRSSMPHGYLKHIKGVSRKRQRGGGSFQRNWSSEKYDLKNDWRNNLRTFIEDETSRYYNDNAFSYHGLGFGEVDDETDSTTIRPQEEDDLVSEFSFESIRTEVSLARSESWDLVSSKNSEVSEDFALAGNDFPTAHHGDETRRDRCCVCFEPKEVTKLMKRCDCDHPSACYECLH